MSQCFESSENIFMQPAAYISALIGRPWQRDGLHCWALVRQVQRDLFGRDLPHGLTISPQSKPRLAGAFRDGLATTTDWRETPAPIHGAVALMHRIGGPPAALVHCGVWLALDTGGLLHTDDPHGVVYDDMPSLTARGWQPRWFIPND